jgi:protease-4
VGLLRIEGSIGLAAGLSGGVSSEQVLEYVRQAEANDRVKALVVFINSPGGTIVPADEIYRALREANKPVVAAMGDIAASGGYYVACGADTILAHPATLTGSIGVYGTLINAAELLEKVGVEGIIVRSGDSKAIGNLFEEPTSEQLAIEQAIVDELHSYFVQAVAESRGMDVEAVRALADGRPYTGQQAVELGLVDDLGGLSDAIERAADLGGIEGEPAVIEYQRQPSLLELWTGMAQGFASDAGVLDYSTVLQWLEERAVVPQLRYVAP